MGNTLGLFCFEEGYFERIWGGTKLRDLYGLDAPQGRAVGEAWLVSDHAQHESRVACGALAGKTLRQIVQESSGVVLGTRVQLTVHGRFPLLLKLLDSTDLLSVQVHPDDETARRLNEPDVGKTEMWHVLHAERDSELICGLAPSVGKPELVQAIRDGSIAARMIRFGVKPGDSVFVPAGTVHAIGRGIVLAEIQQNSDLTYRLYDWERLQSDGTPRPLHIEKGLEAIHFGGAHAGLCEPLTYQAKGGTCTVQAACRRFAAETVQPAGTFERDTHGDSFHILLGKTGGLTVSAAGDEMPLFPGKAILVPGCHRRFTVTGAGECLDYYVPLLERDVVAPLRAAGYLARPILRLGGICVPPSNSSS
jgi:mannose-6-phosphate isomerase